MEDRQCKPINRSGVTVVKLTEGFRVCLCPLHEQAVVQFHTRSL